ncbi:glycerate kinase [Clostridium sp.]|uniref:glycerate kinase family protein n=1 Tax=Clostridium sp. TaxID=1506 RepID=UPI0025840C90|nr:glycerate kinase [Clostridium sp.]MCI6140861.1 glycerate kinase [Clostridium sp.]
MKLLFASDSFKGTLSSRQTIELLTKAAREVFGSCECAGVLVADGGEGTIDAVIAANQGKRLQVPVHGSLMERREAYYGKLDERRAILEMAAASGLPMVPLELREPRNTTTYGTGELLKDALDHGFTDISIAIGGSATNDGGMGCMRALGVRFLDADGIELEGRGADLARVVHIDCSGMDKRIAQAKFTVMCDVNNPLCGKNGATYTFGKQKGGSPKALDELEAGMQNYRDVLIRELGINPDKIPGSGAAGGLGAALLVFCRAVLKSGIETVLDLIDFDKQLEGVSLVITGEGQTDWQSCFGKVIQGVGCRCKSHGIPVIALVGSMGDGAEQIFDYGICSMVTTINGVMGLEEALHNAEELYYNGAVRMFRLLHVGMGLGANGERDEV